MLRALLVALLAACQAPETEPAIGPAPTPIDPGCTVLGAEVVSDPSQATAGLDTTADALVAEVTGLFDGTVDLVGDVVPGMLDVDTEVGEIRAMRYGWVDAHGEPAADPDPGCVDRYEVDVVATFAAGDSELDERVAFTILASSPDDARFSVRVPLDQVKGTLLPLALDPLEWDAVELLVEGEHALGVWQGSLTWRAYAGEASVEDAVGTYLMDRVIP